MSSDNESCDLNYGIEDEVGNSFVKNPNNPLEIKLTPNHSQNEDDHKINSDYSVPRFDKNPKIKPNAKQQEEEEEDIENLLNLMHDEDKKDEKKEKNNDSNEEDEHDAGMEELLNLIGADDSDTESEINNKSNENKREKILIKKDSSAISTTNDTSFNSEEKSSEKRKSTSSITITKLPQDERVFTEKNTGIRLNKTNFKNDSDMNMQLQSSYGKFYKLTDLSRRSQEIKDQGKSLEWYTIFVIASKSDTKSSAKGNSYVVWSLCDLNNLEKQQDLSLFLFGNAYKTHWKSAEFEVFALVKPEFLEGRTNNNSNNYKSNGSTSNWNNFATKTVGNTTSVKLSMSINNDYQLIRLGNAKDITHCASFTKINGFSNKDKEHTSKDSSNRCKNLVNTEKSPLCIYHCVQLDKGNKDGAKAKNKYSMNKPGGSLNRFGEKSLFQSVKSTYSTPQAISEIKFVPNADIKSHRINPFASTKMIDLETKAKVAKEIKSEILLSLNTSIGQQAMVSSPVLSNVAFKTNKKSDKELMALLEGKELDKEEIKKIKIAEQNSTIKFTSSGAQNEANKELKRLFSSKALLPNESNVNNSISSQKLVELKKSCDGNMDYSSKLKEQYEKNKKMYNLSGMASHKDILKEMKKTKEDNTCKEPEILEIETIASSNGTPKSSEAVIAKDFLKKHIESIKRIGYSNKSNSENLIKPKLDNSSGFDLELYVGDKLTSKKLLDPSLKHIPFSPLTATSQSFKRKADELVGKKLDEEIEIESPNDKKAKKLKLIDDILNIKSSHAKDAKNPDKNPHLRTFLDKQGQQEQADNYLCSIRNREVSVVTCKVCDYTFFSQSDYCKKNKHAVNRRLVLQRFFKCKACKTRTYTLDQVCPVKACKQCGAEKFEPSTMKEDDTSILSKDKSNLNQDSEYLIDL